MTVGAVAESITSNVQRSRRRPTANEIGRLFRDHDNGRIDIAADQIRHHRCIDDAQRVDTANPKRAIDHRHLVRLSAHPASAKRVMRGDGGGADMRVECRVRPAIRSRRDFGCGEGPKRCLPADVTGQAKTRSQRRGITVGRKEVLHDPHWSAGIGRGEIHIAPALRSKQNDAARQTHPHRPERKAADTAKPSSAPRRTGTARREASHPG